MIEALSTVKQFVPESVGAATLAIVLTLALSRVKSVQKLSRIRTTSVWIPLMLGFFVFVVLAWWQIGRHNNFYTTGLDMGLFIQSLWNIQHFDAPYSTIRGFENIFGDHFTPFFFILSPVAWVLGADLTLLLLQPLAIAIGTCIVYQMINKRFGVLLALVVAGGYSVFFGHQTALSFDFHPITLFSPLSVMLYHELFLRGQVSIRNLTVLVGASILLQEDVSVVVFYMLAIGFVYRYGGVVADALRKGDIGNRWNKNIVKVSLALAKNWKVIYVPLLLLLPIIYYAVVQHYIIAPLGPEDGYLYTKQYEPAGSSMGEVLQTALRSPGIIVNQLTNPNGKINAFLQLAESSGFLYFISPTAILLSLCSFTIKFLNNSVVTPYNVLHYSAYFYVFTIAAVVSVCRRLEKRPTVLLMLTIYIAIITVQLTFIENDYPYERILEETRKVDENREFRAELQKIDKESTVLADNIFVPHLAERKIIDVAYHYHRPTLEAHGNYDYTVEQAQGKSFFEVNQEDKQRFFSDRQYETVFENSVGVIRKRRIGVGSKE